jgi:hypothetical protein
MEERRSAESGREREKRYGPSGGVLPNDDVELAVVVELLKEEKA